MMRDRGIASTLEHKSGNDAYGISLAAASDTNHAHYNDNVVEMTPRAILRECQFALQGVSGEYLQFYAIDNDENVGCPSTFEWDFRLCDSTAPRSDPYSNQDLNGAGRQLRAPLLLGSGALDALHQCGAMGVQFLQIQSFSKHLKNDSGGIVRALARALAQELHTCQTSLCALSTPTTNMPPAESLREMLVHISTPMARLSALALIVSSLLELPPNNLSNSRILEGPDVLSRMFRHGVRHGDVHTHQALVQRLITAASHPWYVELYQWTVHGLLDVALEFFVSSNITPTDHPDTLARTGGAASSVVRNLWHNGYRLNRDRVPLGMFSSDDLVELAFVVGKGVNFIRHCLHDADWSLQQQSGTTLKSLTLSPAEHACMAELGYVYDSTLLTGPLQQPQRDATESSSSLAPSRPRAPEAVLRRTLQHFAAQVHTHILQSLRHDHDLVQHLFAVKQFLLLGQGDFYCALLDGIHSAHETAARLQHTSVLYRHSLSAIVDSALRSTNAVVSFSPHILDRLSVQLPDRYESVDRRWASPMIGRNQRNRNEPTDEASSNGQGLTVWDIFMLDYSVPDPLAAIVHERAMEIYRSMFVFLFRLNRVEYLLDATWRQSSVLQRSLHANAQYLQIQASTNPDYAQAIILLRQVAMTRQSMVHFVVNVRSYLMSEVLEECWKRLLPALAQAKTLDEVIEAHQFYLHSIHRQSFLYVEINDGNVAVDEDWNLAGKLKTLLNLVGQFCAYQEDLLDEALQAADRAAHRRREAEELSNQDNWKRQVETVQEQSCFGLSDATKLDELDGLSRAFSQEMIEFLTALDQKLNGSPPVATRSKPMPGIRAGADLNRTDRDDDVHDLDSLRFFASQLCHNQFYGVFTF
jgi:gamma-tubulin complex component 3